MKLFIAKNNMFDISSYIKVEMLAQFVIDNKIGVQNKIEFVQTMLDGIILEKKMDVDE
jgi:hypothetical protein